MKKRSKTNYSDQQKEDLHDFLLQCIQKHKPNNSRKAPYAHWSGWSEVAKSLGINMRNITRRNDRLGKLCSDLAVAARGKPEDLDTYLPINILNEMQLQMQEELAADAEMGEMVLYEQIPIESIVDYDPETNKYLVHFNDTTSDDDWWYSEEDILKVEGGEQALVQFHTEEANVEGDGVTHNPPEDWFKKMYGGRRGYSNPYLVPPYETEEERKERHRRRMPLTGYTASGINVHVGESLDDHIFTIKLGTKRYQVPASYVTSADNPSVDLRDACLTKLLQGLTK